jgi:5'-nucleotidase
MHVLVSNDDGVDAPGIRILADAMRALGRVTVVAPDRDRSGASNSLTLDGPIRVIELEATGATASPARRPTACTWR